MSVEKIIKAIAVVRSHNRTAEKPVNLSTSEWGYVCSAHNVSIDVVNQQFREKVPSGFAKLAAKETSVASSISALRRKLTDAGISEKDCEVILPFGQRGRRSVNVDLDVFDDAFEASLSVPTSDTTPSDTTPSDTTPSDTTPTSDAPTSDTTPSGKGKRSKRS
jgi:hypothetical protein